MNMTILSYGDSVTLTLYMGKNPEQPGEWFAPGDAQRVCQLFGEEFAVLEREVLEKEEAKVAEAVKRIGMDRVKKVLEQGNGKA
jgi:hypothetical protein